MPGPPATLLTSEDLSSAIDTVARLDQAARATDGVPALNEAVWRDLERPAPDSAGVLVEGVAYAHVARNDNFSPRHWAVGLAVAPGSRDPEVVKSVLDTAAQHIAGKGGGRAVLWVLDAKPLDDDLMAACDFAPARDLYEMRVPLPIPEEPHWPEGIVVRDFEPGRDEAAWLEVNNRAFRNHPEQGGWIEETLHRRMGEPWFDPSLFLLAFDEQGLAGFDWCKIHEGHGRDPALGEIFVIGVDPRLAGTGLGRPLALAGLARMHGRGIDTGMLFCAADNAPALKLYHSIGFTVHRVDRAYEREVPAA